MKQIPGYDDYSVDEDGNVYSCKWGKIKKLKPGKNTRGYLQVGLHKNGEKKTCPVHRLVYILFVGDIPKDIDIDHIDRDKTNNKLSNLRAVTQQENTFNTNAKGYCWHKTSKKWMASIRLNYKPIHIGYFNTEEEARAAYLAAKEKLHVFVFDKINLNEGSK